MWTYLTSNDGHTYYPSGINFATEEESKSAAIAVGSKHYLICKSNIKEQKNGIKEIQYEDWQYEYLRYRTKSDSFKVDKESEHVKQVMSEIVWSNSNVGAFKAGWFMSKEDK